MAKCQHRVMVIHDDGFICVMCGKVVRELDKSYSMKTICAWTNEKVSYAE